MKLSKLIQELSKYQGKGKPDMNVVIWIENRGIDAKITSVVDLSAETAEPGSISLFCKAIQ